MLCFLVASLALAASTANPPVVDAPAEGSAEPPTGAIVFDARVPAQITLDGQVLGQLFVAAELRFRAGVGDHELQVMRNGVAESLKVGVPAEGTAVVLIGRNGTSTGFQHLAPATPVEGVVPIDLRVIGDEPLQLRLDATRLQLSPGDSVALTLPAGRHRLSLRSAAGTAVFATGTLTVDGGGGGPAVLQLAEGRLPEASGALAFHPAR